MCDEQAGQTMRNQHDFAANVRNCLLQKIQPLAANRMIPITLLHAHKRRVGLFPQALPMFRTGVADAGKNENC